MGVGWGWGEGHPNKRKDNGICPWMDIGWKNQGSYSFSSCKAKSHIVLFPPPRVFFSCTKPCSWRGGGWGAGKTERWERGGLFRVKVMDGGGKKERGGKELKIKEEHAHQPGQLVQ